MLHKDGLRSTFSFEDPAQGVKGQPSREDGGGAESRETSAERSAWGEESRGSFSAWVASEPFMSGREYC